MEKLHATEKLMEINERKSLLRQLIKEKERHLLAQGKKRPAILAQLARTCGVSLRAAQNWPNDKEGWMPTDTEPLVWAFFDYELDQRGSPIKKKKEQISPAGQLSGSQLLELRQLLHQIHKKLDEYEQAQRSN